MDWLLKTIFSSAFLEEISKILVVIMTAVSSIVVALKIDDFRRNREKSKLVFGDLFVTPQNNQYHFRLPVLNDSEYLARSVEVDVEKIIDENGLERRIVPTPLDWAHKEDTRDIYPHQTALLNVLEVQAKSGEFIKVRAPRIMHLKEMVVLKRGKTTIVLTSYQKNGQTEEIKLEVNWNGNENLEEKNLPRVRVI